VRTQNTDRLSLSEMPATMERVGTQGRGGGVPARGAWGGGVVKTDNRELKAEVKRMLARKDFKEYELSAYSPLDQWFGVEGINAPLGDPRFMPDHSLESLARTYRRHLEDERDGLGGSVTDLTNRQVEADLREIEREQGVREALRVGYGAVDRMDPHGTDCYTTWHASRHGIPVPDGTEKGTVPLAADGSALRPTYKLALWLDHQNAFSGWLCVLLWPGAPGEWRWGRAAWREELASYAALEEAA
jgi:hypothetical protein